MFEYVLGHHNRVQPFHMLVADIFIYGDDKTVRWRGYVDDPEIRFGA